MCFNQKWIPSDKPNKDQERLIHTACRYGRFEVIDAIVQQDAGRSKLNIFSLWTRGPPRPFEIRGQNQRQAIDYAVEYNRPELLRYLIQNNVDIASKKADGITPLHDCCQKGNVEMIRILVAAGANVNVMDDYGYTPFSYAMRGNNPEAIAAILVERPKVSAEDLNFALQRAALAGSPKTVEISIDQGADINATYAKGLTPLHYAIQSGSLRTVQALVEAGADIHSIDNNGVTPLLQACESNQPAIFAY